MLLDLTHEMAEQIALSMRQSDRIEVLAAMDQTVPDWAGWSRQVMGMPGYRLAAVLDGVPMLMGGYVEMSNPLVCGTWMVATQAIETAAGRALAARAVVQGHAHAAQRHQVAITWADAQNDDAMAMLLRLGYHGDGAMRTIGGREFVGLTKELQ